MVKKVQPSTQYCYLVVLFWWFLTALLLLTVIALYFLHIRKK